MDYKEQARFLDDYNFRWLLATSVLMLVTSLSLRAWGRSAGLFFLGIFAVCLAMRYLPKYLSLHCEPDRRYRWAVRSRWILIAIGFLLAIALLRFQSAGILLAAISAAWLAVVNGFIKVSARHDSFLAWEWVPYVYLAGDFWLIVVLAYLGLNWLVVAALLALSGFLVQVLAEDDLVLTITLLAAATALIQFGVSQEARGIAIYLNAVLAFVYVFTYYLVHLAHLHARHNHHQIIADLSIFTGMDDIQTKSRLLTSREMLVESWKNAKLNTDDKNALARWYADNSLSYLFDIARFHLTYKHIAFVLDVLRLSRGRCLDYGAGSGALALELAARGCQVTYYDVPGTSRKFAEWRAEQEKLAIGFASTQDEINAEVMSNGRFDTIVSLDVLEHLPDLKGELEYLTSLLAPGGTLFATVPAGATEVHPMHLSHNVDAPTMLRTLGLQNIKTLDLKLSGSEILRKADCLIYRRPA